MAYVSGYSLKNLSTNDKDYKYVTSKMIKTLSPHHRNGIPLASYDILKVDKVLNSQVWESYKKRRGEIHRELGSKVLEKHLFHGSPFTKQITQEGFSTKNAKSTGMFGKGIYFAEHSSKSVQYAYGLNQGCDRHRSIACYDCPRHMLLCRVAMGNPLEATTQMKSGVLPSGYHSIHAVPSNGGLNYPEYVVYDPYQAYPGFLIEYKILRDRPSVQQYP